MEREVIELLKENGKKLTVQDHGSGVALVVWRKNDSPLTVLHMSSMEARRIVSALNKALKDAEKAVAS